MEPAAPARCPDGGGGGGLLRRREAGAGARVDDPERDCDLAANRGRARGTGARWPAAVARCLRRRPCRHATTDVPCTPPPGSRSATPSRRWSARRCSHGPVSALARQAVDVFGLAVLAGVISTTVSATIGVASLSLGDSLSSDALSTWRLWWLGDLGGALLVTPVLLVAVTHWPYRSLPGRAVEAVALVAGLVAVGVTVFTNSTPLAYLTFPFYIWGALRFPQPGAAVVGLIVAGLRGGVYVERREPVRRQLRGRQPAARGDVLGRDRPQRADPRRRDEPAAAGGAGRPRAGERIAGRAPAPPCPRSRESRPRPGTAPGCGSRRSAATSTTCSSRPPTDGWL